MPHALSFLGMARRTQSHCRSIFLSQRGAKTLRTFHEAAGSANGGERRARPPMRLSYYGGGHYDSVYPIVGGLASGGGMFERAGVVLDPPLEPGRLEEEALERSRRRVAEAGSGRWVLLAFRRVFFCFCSTYSHGFGLSQPGANPDGTLFFIRMKVEG